MHKDDWASHARDLFHRLFWRWGCVCRWCKQGEEHHGVGREQGALLERAMVLFYRVRSDAVFSPSLAREIEAWLNAMDEAEDLWGRA